MDNLDRIFSIQEVSTDKVIIRVHADSPLTVAEFPFIKKQWQYITVTRGKKHILVVVKEDGDTFSFWWGKDGHTLISEETEMLRRAVIQFIKENDIILEYDGGKIDNVTIYFNDNFNQWQLNLGDTHYWSKTAKSFEDMAQEVRKFVVAEKWEKAIAQTGIDVWKAHNFKVTLK